jgi:hypothetical protein
VDKLIWLNPSDVTPNGVAAPSPAVGDEPPTAMAMVACETTNILRVQHITLTTRSVLVLSSFRPFNNTPFSETNSNVNVNVNMSAAALRLLSSIPLPGFANAAVLGVYAKNCSRAFHPKLVAPWVFPGFVGFYWFIWPAMGDDFKIRIGWMKDPAPPEELPEVKLDAKAVAAIAKAPMGGAHAAAGHGQDEATVKAEILKSVAGDQAGLQKEWDSFYAKSTIPGEGDDDDDDEGRFEVFEHCVIIV